MMITCPDCGGKIPDTVETCPICGSSVDIYAVNAPVANADDMPPVEKRKIPRKSLIKIFFRRIFELIVFLLICFVVMIVVLMTDFLGARTALRQMCMTDSGSGSEADQQILRVEVKYYILRGLDLIDNGGTGESTIRINFPSEKKTPQAVNVKERKERKPIEIPPDPPLVEPFEDNSKEYKPQSVPENRTSGAW